MRMVRSCMPICKIRSGGFSYAQDALLSLGKVNSFMFNSCSYRGPFPSLTSAQLHRGRNEVELAK